MFESLSKLGKALENFKLDRDTDKEEDEKTSLEEYLDFQKAKEEFTPTEEQKSVMTMEDYPGQTKTGEETLIEQSKTEKKEDQLDQKIKDIQKVLTSFGEKAEDVSLIKTEKEQNHLEIQLQKPSRVKLLEAALKSKTQL
jgi:hypothetical protein